MGPEACTYSGIHLFIFVIMVERKRRAPGKHTTYTLLLTNSIALEKIPSSRSSFQYLPKGVHNNRQLSRLL